MLSLYSCLVLFSPILRHFRQTGPIHIKKYNHSKPTQLNPSRIRFSYNDLNLISDFQKNSTDVVNLFKVITA